MRTKVRQQAMTDCGVACLAMGAECDYEVVHDLFVRLIMTNRPHSRLYLSRIKDLIQVFDEMGIQTQRKRFKTWDSIQGPAIVNLPPSDGLKYGHFIFVDLDPTLGLYINDPAMDLPSFREMPMDVMCCRFDYYKPKGDFLAIGWD